MQQSQIRNFAIIAHVDHGKSTLADRLLELTKTVSKDKLVEQFLDQNPISRERGITIKLAPVRMQYELDGLIYDLNLIDTPGHVDFSYEVSRTLAACEGAILLVDATQGIQAQTVAHYEAAVSEGLQIIPVINKIDLPGARIIEVADTLESLFSFNKNEMIFVSAKTGENVEELIKKIIKRIPPPLGFSDAPLKSLIFDAYYDEHRGSIAYVKVSQGILRKNERISFYQSQEEATASEVGHFSPFLVSQEDLTTGEIGYIVTGVKDIRKTSVGDTIYKKGDSIEPLPGYKKPKPMVFFGIYPKSTKDLPKLKISLEKLELNDTSLTFSEEHSEFLGNGFRVGFLGLLHAEIVSQRLSKEQNLEVLFTMPQVIYKKESDSMLEPYMKAKIYTPSQFIGQVMSVCQKRKGILVNSNYFQNNAILEYEMPFSALIRGLSAELKGSTSGFASLEYEIIDYRKADLSKIDITINGYPIDVLTEYDYTEDAQYTARRKTEKLKDILPRQQFRQIIQAHINGNIVAREELAPFRKDVLAKMSGGDRTRKDKLLDAQKKGKRKMLHHGKIELPQEALYSLIKS